MSSSPERSLKRLLLALRIAALSATAVVTSIAVFMALEFQKGPKNLDAFYALDKALNSWDLRAPLGDLERLTGDIKYLRANTDNPTTVEAGLNSSLLRVHNEVEKIGSRLSHVQLQDHGLANSHYNDLKLSIQHVSDDCASILNDVQRHHDISLAEDAADTAYDSYEGNDPIKEKELLQVAQAFARQRERIESLVLEHSTMLQKHIEKLQDQIPKFAQHVNKEIDQAIQSQASTASTALVISASAGGLAFIFTLIGLTIASRKLLIEVRTRLEAEERLLNTNDELEERVRARTADLEMTNKALDTAFNRAQAATRAKSQFLANMSHEIRTPMNGVLGMLEIVETTRLSDEQRQYLKIASNSAHSLLTVINDILDFSKIEAGRLELHDAPFDLHELIEEVCKLIGAKRHGNVSLDIDYEDSAPKLVVGDADRTRQILLNLVGNALKFTKRGYVKVNVRNMLQPYDSSIAKLKISIEDTGIGIPAEKLESIFDEFSQVDSSTTREYGGTGLGLSITNKLVTLMGGKLEVESQQGVGSTFHVTLEFDISVETSSLNTARKQISSKTMAPANESSPRIHVSQQPSPYKVLLVEDNQANQIVAREYLHRYGCEVTLATNGREALELYPQGNYEVILMDCQMPVLDGYEATKAIRLQEKHGQHIPIIATTAHAMPEDEKRCLAAGMDAYVAKPLVREELYQVLDRYLSPLSPRQTSKQPSTTNLSNKKLNVLIVDDDPANQLVAQKIVESLGHATRLATDGREAVTMWNDGLFDLILMDLQMPNVDGFEATREIRTLESMDQQKRKPTPIIALTAASSDKDRLRCSGAGMDDFIKKPLDPDALSKALERIFSKGLQEVGVTTQMEPAPLQENNIGQSRTLESTPQTFDMDLALRNCSNDMDVFKNVAQAILDDLATTLNNFSQLQAAHKFEELGKLAHRIKGSVSIIGAKQATNLADQISKLCQNENPDKADISTLNESLIRELTLLGEELNKAC